MSPGLQAIGMALAAACLATGCRPTIPAGALVLTQTPIAATPPSAPRDLLDQRYPAGSRVVLVWPPYGPANWRLLSRGLLAAGNPVVCLDGQCIYFVGKTTAAGAWQIFQASPKGFRPQAVTAVAGGARDPAILANGDLVFSSPVPKESQAWRAANPPALYAQTQGQPARRLTFGAFGAVEPTVLQDGRILFVSAHPPSGTNAVPSWGLFTVNNDGTELTPFAADHDGAPWVSRPRELSHGRIAFLAAAAPSAEVWPETVRLARPFLSRAALFPKRVGPCRSVEPDVDGAILACVEARHQFGTSRRGSFAVYRVEPQAQTIGRPLFDDPAWNNVEASRVASRPKPMGHVSAMKPARKSGTILCLDVNFSRPLLTNATTARAERIRVLAGVGQGGGRVLGEVRLLADGSFMAEVPADVPLGFEALDGQGRVLRRLPPALWVRSGENRTCLGCHEPYNRSPRNLRPLAISLPSNVLTNRSL